VAAKPPIRDEEVERILRLLSSLAADRSIVLVGGQAIAFWTRFLDLGYAHPALASVASKDIDFEGSARAVRQAAALSVGLPESLGSTITLRTPAWCCSRTRMACSVRSISSRLRLAGVMSVTRRCGS
jgi:hypothetical protein